MVRIITIASGKGGVGKTTVTANLGTALAIMGYRVCLIDADFGLRNLDIPLGLTNRVIYDLGDFINGKCHLSQIIITDRLLTNLSLIPGSKYYSPSKVKNSLFTEIVRFLSDDYDYILIDSPAGIETGFYNAIIPATESIIVTNTTTSSLQDADRVIGLLEEGFLKDIKLIINMDLPQGDKHFSSTDIADFLQIPLLGTINSDNEMISSVHRGRPIVLNPNTENGLRFRQIAKNLQNYEFTPYRSPDINHIKKRIDPFKKIKTLLKR